MPVYVTHWAFAQHRACHKAERSVAFVPDRAEYVLGCGGCSWRMHVTKGQIIRWLYRLARKGIRGT
jgi:hypothetical protein